MIEIRDLVKVYPGGVAALKGVSLTLPRGMYGLLGPNGSGKTTLMKILAGLLEPTSGAIVKDGVDVTRSPERLRERLGYLPQDFGFYPDLSGKEMLRHLLVLKGVEAPGGLDAYADDLLRRVNLSAAASRPTRTYSGGMRQRLGIAQAIAGNPDLLIVDEPTAGLDPEERIRFYRVLSSLAAERCVLLSTHLVDDVSMLCPRFAVIRYGRMIAETTPAAARRLVAGTMFEGAVDDARLEGLSASGLLTGVRLEEGRTLARIHCADGAAPSDFAGVDGTLEDAYLTITRRAAAAAGGEASVAAA